MKSHANWDNVAAMDRAQGAVDFQAWSPSHAARREREQRGERGFGAQAAAAATASEAKTADRALEPLHDAKAVLRLVRPGYAFAGGVEGAAASGPGGGIGSDSIADDVVQESPAGYCPWRRMTDPGGSGYACFYNLDTGEYVWDAPLALLQWEIAHAALAQGALEAERTQMTQEDAASCRVEDFERRHPNVLLEEDMERELRARLGLVDIAAWMSGEGGGAVKRTLSRRPTAAAERETLPSGEPLPASLTNRFASGEAEAMAKHGTPQGIVLLGHTMVEGAGARVPHYEHADAPIVPLSIALWHGATLADAEVGLCDTEGVLVGRVPAWLLSLHTNHVLLGDMLGAFSRSHIVNSKARCERHARKAAKAAKKAAKKAKSPKKARSSKSTSASAVSTPRRKRVAFIDTDDGWGSASTPPGTPTRSTPMGTPLGTPLGTPTGTPRGSPRGSCKSPRGSGLKSPRGGGHSDRGVNRMSVLTGCTTSTVKWLTGFIFSGAGAIMAPRVPSPGVAAELLPLALVLRMHAVQTCLERSLLSVTAPQIVLRVLEAVMARCAGGEFDCGDVLLDGRAVDMTPSALAAGGHAMDKKRLRHDDVDGTSKIADSVVGSGRPQSSGFALRGGSMASSMASSMVSSVASAQSEDTEEDTAEEEEAAAPVLDGIALSAILKTRAMAPCRRCVMECWEKTAPHVGAAIAQRERSPVVALALWLQYVVARAVPAPETYDLIGLPDPRRIAARAAERARDIEKARAGGTYSFFARLHDEPTEDSGALFSDGSVDAGGDESRSEDDSFDEAERPHSAYRASSVQFRLDNAPSTPISRSGIWERIANRKALGRMTTPAHLLGHLIGSGGTVGGGAAWAAAGEARSAAVELTDAERAEVATRVAISASAAAADVAIAAGDRLIDIDAPGAAAELAVAEAAFEAANTQQLDVLAALHAVGDGSSSEEDWGTPPHSPSGGAASTPGRKLSRKAERAAARRRAKAEKRRQRDATPTLTRLTQHRAANDLAVAAARTKIAALEKKMAEGTGYSLLPAVARRQRVADEAGLAPLQKDLDTELYWFAQIRGAIDVLRPVYEHYMALKQTIERGARFAAARARERLERAGMAAEDEAARGAWRAHAAAASAMGRAAMLLEDRRRVALTNALRCEAATTLDARPSPPLDDLQLTVWSLGPGDRVVLQSFFQWIGGDELHVEVGDVDHDAPDALFAVAAEDGGPPPPPPDEGPPWVEGDGDDARGRGDDDGAAGGSVPLRGDGSGALAGWLGDDDDGEFIMSDDGDMSDTQSVTTVGTAQSRSTAGDGSPRSARSPRSRSPRSRGSRSSRKAKRAATRAEAERTRQWKLKRRRQPWLFREDELGDPEMLFILLRISRDLNIASLTEDLYQRCFERIVFRFELLPTERDGEAIGAGDDSHGRRPDTAESGASRPSELGSDALSSASPPHGDSPSKRSAATLSVTSEATTWSRVTMSTGYRELLAELSGDSMDDAVEHSDEEKKRDQTPTDALCVLAISSLSSPSRFESLPVSSRLSLSLYSPSTLTHYTQERARPKWQESRADVGGR